MSADENATEVQAPLTEIDALIRVAEAIRDLPVEAERVERERPMDALRYPISNMMRTVQELGDPSTIRELQRDKREREQARLYRLVVVFAALSAIASVASVIVALVNA